MAHGPRNVSAEGSVASRATERDLRALGSHQLEGRASEGGPAKNGSNHDAHGPRRRDGRDFPGAKVKGNEGRGEQSEECHGNDQYELTFAHVEKELIATLVDVAERLTHATSAKVAPGSIPGRKRGDEPIQPTVPSYPGGREGQKRRPGQGAQEKS